MKIFWLFFIFLIVGCEKNVFEDKQNDPVYNFECFWHEVDRNYPFFSYTGLYWDSVYIKYRPLIKPDISTYELFEIYGKMLDLLNDAHTCVYSPHGIGGNIHYFERFSNNLIDLPDTLFDNYFLSRVFEYGKLKNYNIGYIKIKNFNSDLPNYELIDTILQKFESTIGLIVDVRSNFGGNLNNATTVASRFADTTRFIARQRARNGKSHNDFGEWKNLYISPDKTGIHYKKPSVILTSRWSFSATEWFVLCCREFPNVTIMGDITGGGSSPLLFRELPNSWILQISNSQVQTNDGTDFQFIGLIPDKKVTITEADKIAGIDTILESAIQFLTN